MYEFAKAAAIYYFRLHKDFLLGDLIMKKTLLLIICALSAFLVISIIVSAGTKQENLSSAPESKSTDSKILKNDKKETNGLIGTWIKEETMKEGGNNPRDKEWKLTVTFNNNSQFIWDSKRRINYGEIINDSLLLVHDGGKIWITMKRIKNI